MRCDIRKVVYCPSSFKVHILNIRIKIEAILQNCCNEILQVACITVISKTSMDMMLIINLVILLLFPSPFLKPWETPSDRRIFGAHQQDTWKGVTRDGREHRGSRER